MDDHSASRRADVLRREAPHLVAPEPRTLRVVVDVEADDLGLLGTWQETTDEGQVWYTTTDGHYRWAPDDCVCVVTVTLP